MPEPRFQFYEIVRVASGNATLATIHGETGAILGMAEHDDGAYGYAVFIYRDQICWSIDEEDLEATGRFSSREAFYDGTSVRVRVDEHGRGWIVDEEEPSSQNGKQPP